MIRLHVKRIAARVEHLRGLRFRRIPKVVVMQPDQLQRVGEELRRRAVARIRRSRIRLARSRRLASEQRGLETLAGILPVEEATDASASSASEQVGGAYDYSRDRVILIDRGVQTRHELELVLAHELTHALEDQHFALRLATSRRPAQIAQSRRALIEGTATFVATLYDGKYLHDRLPVGMRLAGQRSVFAAGGATPFAIKANTIFDYVDGPLFVQSLYRRDHGSWRDVNDAIRHPPQQTDEVLHPRYWPSPPRSSTVRLGLGAVLAPDRALVGGGPAGEEDLRTLLGAGGPDLTIDAAAAGWRGGRFELWRPPNGSCAEPCPAEDVAVAGFRFASSSDIPELSTAFFDYALLGRLGQRVSPRTWSFREGGYGALATRRRSAAIAFAPAPALARRAATRAAVAAAP